MERFAFSPETAFVPRRGARLENVTVAPLTQPMFVGAPFQAAELESAAGLTAPIVEGEGLEPFRKQESTA